MLGNFQFMRPASGGAAPSLVAPTLIATTSVLTTQSYIDCASFTPTANSLLIAVQRGMDSSANAPKAVAPSNVGIGVVGAWETITAYQAKDDLLRFIGTNILLVRTDSSPGTGTIRFNLTGNCFKTAVSIYEVTQGFGTDLTAYPRITGGTNGTSLGLTLAGTPETDSLMFSSITENGYNANDWASAAPTGHTQFTQVQVGATSSNALDGSDSYKLGSGAALNTWTSCDNTQPDAGVALEILQAA